MFEVSKRKQMDLRRWQENIYFFLSSILIHLAWFGWETLAEKNHLNLLFCYLYHIVVTASMLFDTLHAFTSLYICTYLTECGKICQKSVQRIFYKYAVRIVWVWIIVHYHRFSKICFLSLPVCRGSSGHCHFLGVIFFPM